MNIYSPIISGSVVISGSLSITGSLSVPLGITGSVLGTASYANQALSSSYAVSSTDALSSSYALSSSTAINAISSSFSELSSNAISAVTASFATNFTASNILVNNAITAQTLVVQTVTSSVVYSSGSNIFGNSQSNTQRLTGSVLITGSLTTTGALSGTSATFSSSVTSNANEAFIVNPSSGASYIRYKIGATSYSLTGVAGNVSDIINNSAVGDLCIRNSQRMLFSTNAGDSASMTITSGGNVGIGTSSPALALDVVGRIRNTFTSPGTTVLEAYNPSTTGYGVYFSGGTSSNYALQVADYANNVRFTVRGDGATFLNGFTYGNTVSGGTRTLYIDNSYALGGISSIRASKKNIEEFSSQWIYDLKPVQFNYRKKDEDGNYTEDVFDELTYGLIAEDTAPIADFLINYNDKEDGTKEMVGIEYSRLITPMLKAMQEQQAQIEELKALINK